MEIYYEKNDEKTYQRYVGVDEPFGLYGHDDRVWNVQTRIYDDPFFQRRNVRNGLLT